MSPKLNRRMKAVLEELEFREDVKVLVLTGEGEAWTGGMDLREYFRETEAQGLWAVRKSQRESYGWFERLRWYEKPTIAMVGGWCFGGAAARKEATRQFLHEKSCKPGLGTFNASKVER
jgi:trans-feruloyl-CoA hydratase/vanillin synthase